MLHLGGFLLLRLSEWMVPDSKGIRTVKVAEEAVFWYIGVWLSKGQQKKTYHQLWR